MIETVWEAPGYEIPFVQLNRAEKFGFPFRGYHSTLDTPDLIKHDQLSECLDSSNAL
jgi:aminopeptidase-like protein